MTVELSWFDYVGVDRVARMEELEAVVVAKKMKRDLGHGGVRRV